MKELDKNHNESKQNRIRKTFPRQGELSQCNIRGVLNFLQKQFCLGSEGAFEYTLVIAFLLKLVPRMILRK